MLLPASWAQCRGRKLLFRPLLRPRFEKSGQFLVLADLVDLKHGLHDVLPADFLDAHVVQDGQDVVHIVSMGLQERWNQHGNALGARDKQAHFCYAFGVHRLADGLGDVLVRGDISNIRRDFTQHIQALVCG